MEYKEAEALYRVLDRFVLAKDDDVKVPSIFVDRLLVWASKQPVFRQVQNEMRRFSAVAEREAIGYQAEEIKAEW